MYGLAVIGTWHCDSRSSPLSSLNFKYRDTISRLLFKVVDTYIPTYLMEGLFLISEDRLRESDLSCKIIPNTCRSTEKYLLRKKCFECVTGEAFMTIARTVPLQPCPIETFLSGFQNLSKLPWRRFLHNLCPEDSSITSITLFVSLNVMHRIIVINLTDPSLCSVYFPTLALLPIHSLRPGTSTSSIHPRLLQFLSNILSFTPHTSYITIAKFPDPIPRNTNDLFKMGSCLVRSSCTAHGQPR